jgi:hypothetical protein
LKICYVTGFGRVEKAVGSVRVRSLLSIATAVVAFLVVPATSVAADSPVQLLYTFDSCRTAEFDCTQAVPDSSGNDNHATVKRVSGGTLDLLPGAHGLGVHLSGALLQLESTGEDEAFNPGTRTFSYGAMVKLNRAFPGDANLLQRGRYSEVTNQWKLQLDAGSQGCVVKGDKGRVLAFSPTDLPGDGRWHTVACVVTPAYVTYVVDGRPYRTPNTAGSITFASTELLHVGGVFNQDGAINDPFTQPIDNVFFAS